MERTTRDTRSQPIEHAFEPSELEQERVRGGGADARAGRPARSSITMQTDAGDILIVGRGPGTR